ncbi:MAG: hypothetical protein IT531_23575 [Burkholderiales bacterium]|nr:hypothetical protein [Burkholderiales bacterium]
MSVVTEILDRLSGIAALKERLTAQQSTLDKHDEWLFDHEKRLLQLENVRSARTPRRRIDKA